MNFSQLSDKLSDSKVLFRAITIVALFGIVDTVYLTVNHYLGSGVECLLVGGCEQVLTSDYSRIFGIPLSLLGLLFYAAVFILINVADIYRNELSFRFLLTAGATGFIVSLGLLYIQIFTLEALCFYCLVSFATSTLIFALSLALFRNHSKELTSQN